MSAPGDIVGAVTRRDAAARAVAVAEAAHAMAQAEAEAADQRLADISQVEQQAAGDMADRIRAAVTNGGTLKAAKPSADAVARSSAEADSRAARAAAMILANDVQTAKVELANAEEGVGLATYTTCNAMAERVVADMQAAYRILEDGYFALHALESAAMTATSDGMKRLSLDEQGRKFISFDLAPRFRLPQEKTEGAARWLAWRNSLIADPYAASPWDGQA